MNSKLISLRTLLTFIFFLSLVSYATLRAYTLSFTHDESISFTILAGETSFINSANNHFLNTHLMSLSRRLFGDSEISLRLPNVLSFVLYLGAWFFILKSSKSAWFYVLGLSLALLNPFLLEFFSLARGYGLSISLMTLSLFFMLRNGNHYLKFSSLLKDFIFTLLFASLAVGANLTMLNFLIAVVLIFCIKFLFFIQEQDQKGKYTLQFISIALISFTPLLIGIRRVLMLKNLNELYFGTAKFINGFDTLLNMSIYFTDYTVSTLSAIKTILALFIILGTASVAFKREFDGKLFLTLALIFILAIGLFSEHVLFEALYPTQRTALYYTPILALLIYYLFQHLLTRYKIMKTIYIPIVLFLILPLSLNFIRGVNLTSTRCWDYDAKTKEVMAIVSKSAKQSDHKKIINAHWLFKPTVNYYINTLELSVQSTESRDVDSSSDFIYQYNNDRTYSDFIVFRNYKTFNTSLLMKIEVSEPN